MKAEQNKPMGATVDEAITGALAKTYRHLSRRAFLSSLTRKAIGLAGVAIAARALPLIVPEAQAQIQSTCGLAGRLCGGACQGGAAEQSWMQCCPGPAGPGECPYYTCCSYQDLCAASRPAGCGALGGAVSWCSGTDLYICTQFVCNGFYENQSSCSVGCAPAGLC